MAKQVKPLSEQYLETWAKYQGRLEARDMERVAQSFMHDLEHDQSKDSASRWSDATIQHFEATTMPQELAKDKSRDAIDPALAVPEVEKAKHVERDLDIVEEQKSLFEGRWAAEVKSRAEESMFRGNGATDELYVKSAGQYSTSFSQLARPGSTQADLDAAVDQMGLAPQVERQKAMEAGIQKGQDQARDVGREAER